MARDDLHFKLRIPADLKAKVEAAAERSGGSMTAEINARVAASFEIGAKLSDMDTKLDLLISKIDALGRQDPKV